MEGIVEMAEERVKVAFSKNLKTTTKDFSDMTVELIQKRIMESCHDMIHEHLDKIDIQISPERFKSMLRDLINAEYPHIGKKLCVV